MASSRSVEVRRSVPPPLPNKPRAQLVVVPDDVRETRHDTLPDGIDLDAIVSDLGRSKPAPIPDVPPVLDAPPKRWGWPLALGLTASSMILGLSIALAVVLTRPTDPDYELGASKPIVSVGNVVPEPVVAPPSVSGTAAALEPIVLGPSAPTLPRARARRPMRTVEREVTLEAESEALGQAAPSLPAVEVTEPASEAPPDEEALMEAAARDTDPAARAEEPIPEELPEQPTRISVQQALSGVSRAVQACAPGAGQATIAVRFANSGRVAEAIVESPRASPAQRSCMARAARAARVPAFRQEALSVHFPVRL
jgi:hypothetical protein